ncbi:MAG: type II secretion system protein [Mollicutes bacterium]|nr:type II secretion system protein [Mollicutes bacterium]
MRQLRKENGFTLAEVLGVIVILSVLVIILIPPIANQIIKSKNEISKATLQLIYSATESYMTKKQNEYPIYNGNVYCIQLQDLVDNNELKAPIKDIKIGKEIDLANVVKVSITNIANIDYEIIKSENCEAIDRRFPALKLVEGMIPIYWDSNNVVRKADINNAEGAHQWYDYDEQMWANVVLVTESTRNAYINATPGTEIIEDDVLAYLVWIPRYRYKLFNVESAIIDPQEIEIEFEDRNVTKSNGSENGEWLTHPAFTFGDEELNGFWVGKFETTGDATTPTIKPGVSALRSENISTQFATAKKFNNVSTYGLSSDADAHMMKNMEWGAVAYLSHSKYGKNNEIEINSNKNYYTGGGSSNAYITNIGQSTTGNVYGVYDMSGGAYEYVMGGMYNSDGTTIRLGSSGFVQATIDGTEMEKYIDKYAYGTSSSDYTRRKLGDATGETRGWYSDFASFVRSSGPWFRRGGNYSSGTTAGAFTFSIGSGTSLSDDGFRLAVPGVLLPA